MTKKSPKKDLSQTTTKTSSVAAEQAKLTASIKENNKALTVDNKAIKLMKHAVVLSQKPHNTSQEQARLLTAT